MTAPKGLICGSWAAGTGPSGMLNARSGFPLGIFVTESLPQLATQMLPLRSETVPCGHEMLPCRNPRGPEMAVPSGRNADTLSFRAAMRGSFSHGGSWNPKFPTQTFPLGSRVMPYPAPLRPPPKYGDPGKFSPHG